MITERVFSVISSLSFSKLVRDDKFVITFYDIKSNQDKTLRCEVRDMDLATSYSGTRIVIFDLDNKTWLALDTCDIKLIRLENGIKFDKKDLYELAYKLGEIDFDKVNCNDETQDKDTEIISDIKNAISLYKDKNKPNYGSDF